jgi:ketosteroid isomerase-like protein
MPEADARPDTAAIVREHLDHVERGDIVQAIADYAEDAVLEADVGGEQGLLFAGTFRGREAIGRWIDNWFSSFEPGSYRFEVVESIDNGDRVFMTTLNTARGGASGVDVALRVYHAFTVRDGLIVRHAFSGEQGKEGGRTNPAREALLRAAGIDSR